MDEIEIAGKFFPPDEAREIDVEIDKLDALMKQRRERVLAAMDAEQCSCTGCEVARQFRLSDADERRIVESFGVEVISIADAEVS